MDIPGHLRDRLAGLAPEAERLLLGVSGGADSVALLRSAVAAGFEVVAAHLDHGLRDGSGEDARFVAQLAGALGAEFRGDRVEVGRVAESRGWNVEEAGRRLRYEFLSRSARDSGAQAIVTAHTLDDQAETVLMQLLRGAAYLRGMPPVRRRLVRPLLDVPHSELLDYLRGLGQPWREDASNQDRRLLRAWLRHEVIPLLAERFPALSAALARHARLQADVADHLGKEASRYRRDAGFDTSQLLRLHPALQREAIRWLFDAAGTAPASERIEEIRLHLDRTTPYRQTLAPGLSVRIAYGRLELARHSPAAPERPIEYPHQLPAGVPADVLDYPQLKMRARRPGDRMRLAGGSKSLARILIDRKVPREERDSLAVLASGQKVLWAEGVGLAAEVAGEVPGDVAHDDEVPGDEGHDDVRRYMRRALELADAAASQGELPVGAVVVCDGQVLGEGHNETEARNDPTAHAELLALRRAAWARGDWRLSGCTLVVTLEPCPMCAGSLLQSHLSRVVYGAANLRDGALGSVDDLLGAPWKRSVAVTGGVMAREASERLSRFFARRRSR